METRQNYTDAELSELSRTIVSDITGIPAAELSETSVTGGYSLNKRVLIGVDTNWVFVKQVDTAVLVGDGTIELEWLAKDYRCMEAVRRDIPGLVPQWSRLEADGHALLMPGYRTEDGWLWSPPDEPDIQKEYIQAVVDATKRLEQMTFDQNSINTIHLEPVMRDELALDEGFSLIMQNETMLKELEAKYRAFAEETPAYAGRFKMVYSLLSNRSDLGALAERARQLTNQPQDKFGHCDVRSDNLAYHPETGELKFVDWNWASFGPSGLGATEFLIDMARRGIDVTPWLSDLNPELLAATTGYYLRKCLLQPLAPGNTLRQMQAESAAAAYELFEAVTSKRM